MRRSWLTAAMGLLVILIAAGLDAMVIYRGLPNGADSVLTGTILGAWNAAAGVVLNFYFGRSSDSDRKTEIIANATPAAAQPTAAATPQASQANTP